MTLAQICQRFNKEGVRFPKQIRRKSWTESEPYNVVYCSSNQFYTSPDWELAFPFDVEDLVAKDWQYIEDVWCSK